MISIAKFIYASICFHGVVWLLLIWKLILLFLLWSFSSCNLGFWQGVVQSLALLQHWQHHCQSFYFHTMCCQKVIIFIVVQLAKLQLLWLLPHNWCYEEILERGRLVMWFDMGYTIVHYCNNDLDLGTHDLMKGGK